MAQTPRVAIAGATGGLGSFVTEALLSERWKSSFKEIIVLTRKASDKTENWKQAGATVRIYSEQDEDILEALKDVDVYVNTIGPTGHDFKSKIMNLLSKTPIILDFLSEFGVDHYTPNFPPHKEWDTKKAQAERARSLLLAKAKVVQVFAGLFLEDSFGPWFGFDTDKGVYEAVGSGKAKVSFTSKTDVGNAVAAIALMDVDDVPETVRLSGDVGTFESIAAAMAKAGGGEINVTETELEPFKEKVLKEDAQNPTDALRFLMGEGKINHGPDGIGNDNEMVNPGEKKWRWKTIQDFAQETKGRGSQRDTAGGYEGK